MGAEIDVGGWVSGFAWGTAGCAVLLLLVLPRMVRGLSPHDARRAQVSPLVACGINLVLAIVLVLLVQPERARAQDAPAAGAASGPSDGVAFGIEQLPVLEAMAGRIARLEASQEAQLARLAAVSEESAATARRMARGDEPLVALEIEQLWSMVESLEAESATLRDEVAALRAQLAAARLRALAGEEG